VEIYLSTFPREELLSSGGLASLALEGVWRGKSEKLLYLEAFPKRRICTIDTPNLGLSLIFRVKLCNKGLLNFVQPPFRADFPDGCFSK
jgi:hypothetical protein